MNYSIITDTSCDISGKRAEDLNLSFVPFHLYIDGKEYVDDKDLNIDEFLKAIKESQSSIKTSCPSTGEYLEALDKQDADNIFVVTISSKLSGSHNAAMLAANEYSNSHPEKNIQLIDSKSAGAGHSAVIVKMGEIIEKDMSFDETSSAILEMIEDNHTYFVLKSFDTLIKSGRIGRGAGIFANLLKIKPICKGEDGKIAVQEINRSFKKSINRLSQIISDLAEDFSDKILVISHVDNEEAADILKSKIKDLYNFKDILVLKSRGLSSVYADIGGVILGF